MKTFFQTNIFDKKFEMFNSYMEHDFTTKMEMGK